jgi:hypothetical protein
MWRHHRQETSFLLLFGEFFFSKTGNLQQNILFSEYRVAVWRFFAKNKITAPVFAHHIATAPQLQTQAD